MGSFYNKTERINKVWAVLRALAGFEGCKQEDKLGCRLPVVRRTRAQAGGRGLEATGGGWDGADSSPCDSDGTMRERGISAHTYAKREGEERERS
jgi:hypothetical protein